MLHQTATWSPSIAGIAVIESPPQQATAGLATPTGWLVEISGLVRTYCIATSVIPLAATVSEFAELKVAELLRSFVAQVDSIATTRLTATR